MLGVARKGLEIAGKGGTSTAWAGLGLGTGMGGEIVNPAGAVAKDRIRQRSQLLAGRLANPRRSKTLMQPQGRTVLASEREKAQLLKIAQVLQKQAAPLVKKFNRAKLLRALNSGGGGRRPDSMTVRQMLRRSAPYILGGTALATAGAATGLAEDGVRHGLAQVGEARHRAGESKRYAAMLRADPSLRDEPHARQLFGVLHRASAYIAGEPVLAASAVKNMAATGSLTQGGKPNINPGIMSEILRVQKARQDTMPGAAGKPGKPAFTMRDILSGAELVGL